MGKGIYIGNVFIAGNALSAPMAGVTDACFRRILSEFGAPLIVTEMISAKGLLHGNAATRDLLAVCEKTGAVSAQLFGNNPGIMGESAAIIAKDFPYIDIIDINCGCPAPKVHKNGEGSALMREPRLIGKIVRSVAAAGKPVSVKLRKGFGKNDNTAVQAALHAQEAGASAICVHGRTASQLYGGAADWSVIADVKKAADVPVIGNGDITSPESAADMMSKTGCDAVMIGRALWGNPWLIKRVQTYLETGELLPEPTASERLGAAVRHTRMLTVKKGISAGLREARSHLHMYTKGLRGSSSARVRINRAETMEDVTQILRELEHENIT